MKRSTVIIVVVASAASLLLLAVPKRGAEPDVAADPQGTQGLAVALSPSPAARERQQKLSSQAQRLRELTWARNPFTPVNPPQSLQPTEPDPPAEDPKVNPSPAPDPIQILPLLPEPPAPRPALSGISQSGAYRFAILDRQIVEEGDSLPSGEIVLAIGNRTVTLRSGEETLIIRLGDGQ